VGILIEKTVCPHCDSGHNTPCFAVYTDGYKCFSCGKFKQQDDKFRAYRPKNLKSSKEFQLPKIITNPEKFGTDMLKWLYDAYVFEDLIKKYGIGYIPHEIYGKTEGESLIFPVFGPRNKLLFYQRRFFPKKEIYSVGPKEHFIVKRNLKRQKKLVMVEDYLSTIRIGEICDCLCLFGTNLKPNIIKDLLDEYEDIIIWLDNDDAGITGRTKIHKFLNTEILRLKKYYSFKYRKSFRIQQINSERDPKYYSNEEIRQLIHENN
jgi:hypothetical protein